MKATILIPVKALTSAKSRLTKYLSTIQREKLVLEMLQHVIEIIKTTNSQYEIFVVTSDQKVEAFAKSLQVKIISEKNPGHNRALTFAAKQINQEIPILTISADLPMVTTDDIKQMFLLLQDRDIVLAPSKEKTGTNAILMKKPLLISYQFGSNSLAKFIYSLKEKKLTYRLYKKQTIAFDVDTMQDIASLHLYSLQQ